jgi:hypothetical protein
MSATTGLTLATAKWMVMWVHGNTSHTWSDPKHTTSTGFTQRYDLMLFITHLPY